MILFAIMTTMIAAENKHPVLIISKAGLECLQTHPVLVHTTGCTDWPRARMKTPCPGQADISKTGLERLQTHPVLVHTMGYIDWPRA
jgi:hypothetical protein